MNSDIRNMRDEAFDLESASCALSIHETVKGQPFCAGILVERGGKHLFTLGDQDRWEEDGHLVIPVAWIGGGQKNGEESPTECAIREAKEEVDCAVELSSSPVTLLFPQGSEPRVISTRDEIRPALVELRPGAVTPYARGLPLGPVLFVVVYRATLLGSPLPGDVPGLIEVGDEDLPHVRRGITLREARARGIKITTKRAIDEDAVLRLRAGGVEDCICALP